MIEPGKNGRRSGNVAKGRCETGRSAKNGRPLVRWILSGPSGVCQARRRRVRGPGVAAAANAVAEHPCKRSCERVQRASRSVAGGGIEARYARRSMNPRSRSGH